MRGYRIRVAGFCSGYVQEYFDIVAIDVTTTLLGRGVYANR